MRWEGKAAIQPLAEGNQPRRLGVLGLTTCLKGLKNSDSETPSGAKIAARESTVTPLSPWGADTAIPV